MQMEGMSIFFLFVNYYLSSGANLNIFNVDLGSIYELIKEECFIHI